MQTSKVLGYEFPTILRHKKLGWEGVYTDLLKSIRIAKSCGLGEACLLLDKSIKEGIYEGVEKE